MPKNYKKRTRDFVLVHDESKLGTWGRNHKNGTTLCRKLKALRGNIESGS